MAKQERKNFKDKVVKVDTSGFDGEMNRDPAKPVQTPILDAPEPDDELTPFATRLPQSLIERLQNHVYWDRTTITESVADALEMLLSNFPNSEKPIPEGVRRKTRGRKKKE